MEVIVTFIAILELVKSGRLEFLQTHSRGPIWLQKPSVEAETEAIVKDDEDLKERETEI